MPTFRKLRSGSRLPALDSWTAEADAISLPRLDEIGGHPRPPTVGVTYGEKEYDALAGEQELAWPAEGEHEARPYQVRARGVDLLAEATEFLLVESEADVRQAHADHQLAVRVLGPYVRGEAWAKLRYWICWPILWCGDTAGIWSAAITNGDIPAIAFGQACAAGLAGACAGLVGSELKHLRMAQARHRDPETLTGDELRYQRLFTGAEGGTGIVKVVGLLSLLVALLLAGGIFTLRMSVEGTASGITFGLLALGTAIGSCLLSYCAADEVADVLGALDRRAKKAGKHHLRLARSVAFKKRARSEETARSIHEEYLLRGHAAGKRVESLSWRVQRRNPQVFGHGLPHGEATGVIGRRTRRGTVAP
ncbi:MAG: putative rane protein [Acidimicrobiaceae bacterium]|nr:putative rane protein [Acidimicrobiaceae bacterium]